MLVAVLPGAARSILHTVLRGETLESIAANYGVDAQDILKSNGLDRIYVGMKLHIDIPETEVADEQQAHHSPPSANIPTEESMMADAARRQMEANDFGGAVKSYNKLIKKYPNSAYYFNRGIAQLQRGKNRQAANDFRASLNSDGCNDYIAEKAPELQKVAESRHAQWKEEQSQLWGSLAAAAVGVGLQTWATVETAKAVANATPVYSSAASGSSDDSYSSSSSSSSSQSNTSSSSKQPRKCGVCSGKGYIVKSVASFGIRNDKWCKECGKTVANGHYHATCTQCNGSGER